ncbi:hypothetical protein JCM3770_005391 [Rhodotorula araucariae]
MPNTLPPTSIDATAAFPVHPAGHGQAAYRAGDDLPAVLPDSGAPSPSGERSRSRSRSRARAAGGVKDPFFKPESRSASREPGRAEQLQKEAALRQVRAAQDASYEADLERAIRRSKRDDERARSQSGSRASSMSRIRAAIKDIVSDPFWHRASKEEGEHQDDAMRRIILEEVSAARASTTAGSRDRDHGHGHGHGHGHSSRAGSRVRSPLSSQPGSRAPSRVRGVVDALAGAGGANVPYDRKPVVTEEMGALAPAVPAVQAETEGERGRK